MGSVTGVEIGPDYCVLVRVRRRDTATEVTAVRLFDPLEWSRPHAERVALLRDARRHLALPRRAVVVLWDASRGPRTGNGEALLGAAGFDVQDVLSPRDALALLARSRGEAASPLAAAWLSINRHGAAIAVVRNVDVLYSREFAWRIQAPEQRVQAHLLRRYLHAAQITPELRRATDAVLKEHGDVVDAVAVCGNVPDLGSLSAALARDLALEFDTLDAMDGLRAAPPVASIVSQTMPAIRLAAAAAASPASGVRRRRGVGLWLGMAAALVLAVGAAWWAFGVWAFAPPVLEPRDPRALPPAIVGASRPPTEPVGTSSSESPPLVPPLPQPTTGQTGSDRPEGDTLQPLNEPLPAVGGVLISAERRLAVVDGAVVGVGERVGSRTVVRIDLEAVVLREPSGREVRVPVRSRAGTS